MEYINRGSRGGSGGPTLHPPSRRGFTSSGGKPQLVRPHLTFDKNVEKQDLRKLGAPPINLNSHANTEFSNANAFAFSGVTRIFFGGAKPTPRGGGTNFYLSCF